MTRETKVGLLIGLGVILLIGIIVSDHLSVAQSQDPAALTEFAPRAAGSIYDGQGGRSTSEQSVSSVNRSMPIPTPEELRAEPEIRRAQPAPTPTSPLASATGQDTGFVPLMHAERRPATDLALQAIPTPNEMTLSHEALPPPPPLTTRLASVPVAPAVEVAPPAVSPATDRVIRFPVPTPAAPAVGVTPPTPSRATVVHEVAEGETLFEIARKYYGDGEQWRTIARHNASAVRENGHVGVGVRLVLPAQPEQSSAARQLVNAANQALSAPTPGRSTATTSATITVGEGDTLIALARRHLGDGDRWKELLTANKGKLDDPRYLRAGMTLNLPAAAAAAPAASAAPAAPRAAAGAYTVKAGDTLYRIAERALGNGDRWNDLYEANRDKLDSPNDLKVGQTLRLPS